MSFEFTTHPLFALKVSMPDSYVTRLVKVAAILLTLILPPAKAEAKTILTFGDSLTAGYGLEEKHGFVAQLQTALRRTAQDITVKNGSVSGHTTAGGRSRLAWTLNGQIDLVIVELGANDALRGVDPGETRRNLDAILSTLKRRGIRVLLAGMRAPPNLGPDYAKAFDSIYPELSKAHGIALYPFFLDGVAAVPGLNQRDGIHPNNAGVKVIVDAMTPYVLKLIE